MRLKRVFLVATGVLAALFLLEACSSDSDSDSGSSAGAISVDGLWSIYEPELNPDGTPTGYSLALAYNAGPGNKPKNDGALKTQFLQLTSSLQFQQACGSCGQDADGLRLYGVFLSINNQFTCTPDLGNNNPLPYGKWMTFYGRLDGTEIKDATITGSIQEDTCQSEQNSAPRGPDNCAPPPAAGDIFPNIFSFPVKVQVSGGVVFEELIPPDPNTGRPAIGYCKMVLDYEKSLLPDSGTGAPPSQELSEFCDTTGSFELYRSVFRSTQPTSTGPTPPPPKPPACEEPDPPPFCNQWPRPYEGACGRQPSAACLVADPPSWCNDFPPDEPWRIGDIPPYEISKEGDTVTDRPQWSDNTICGTRDAFRFEREPMYEHECLSTPFVE